MLLVLLGVLSFWGCSGTPENGGAPPPPEPVNETTLRTCPHGDAIWYRAINEAHQAGNLAGFADLAATIAATCPDRWEPVWADGECRFRQQDAQAAAARFEAALELATSLDDPVGVSRVSNRLGWIAASAFRDSHRAETLYREALGAAVESERHDLEAFANNNLAGLLLSSGRLAEGLERLRAAIAGLNEIDMTAAARQAEFNLANYLYQLGSLVEAGEALSRLQDEATNSGDGNLLAHVQLLSGHVRRLVDDRSAAQSWYSKIPDDYPAVAAAAALGLGRLAIADGDLDEAARDLDEAAAQDDNPEVALLASAHRAEVDVLRGKPDEARARLTSLLDHAEGERSFAVTYIAKMFLGKTLMLEGHTEDAAAQFRDSIELIESQGSGLDPTREGMAYLRERAEPYADLAASLAQLDGRKHVGEILTTIERSHARALRRVLHEGGAASPRIAGLDELVAALGDDGLLLDFVIGEDRGVVLAVGTGGARAHALPGWRELREPLRRYRQALLRPLVSAEARLDPEDDLRRDIEPAKALRRQLLGPVADLLAAARRVYVVPDQDLALLPFAALPLDESGSATIDGPLRFLGEQVEFAVLPLAGAPPSWKGPRGPVLLAGDPLPDRDGEFGALPLAADELNRLGEIWSSDRVTRLESADLLPDRLRQLPLDEFRTLHFATHAVASSLDPRRCAVIFSDGAKLTMQEVAELDLGPALVVLSACRTGEGEVIPGEGVVGLSWAFLRAGARGVAASLWSVEDQSTAELMEALHRNLRAGRDPVDALARAQRALMSRRGHPAYWSPFVVVVSPAQ